MEPLDLLKIEKTWERHQVFARIYQAVKNEWPKGLRRRYACVFCDKLSEELQGIGVRKKLTPPRLHEFMRPPRTPGHRHLDDSMYRAALLVAMRFPTSRKALLERIEMDITGLQELHQVISQQEFTSEHKALINDMLAQLNPDAKAEMSLLPDWVKVKIAKSSQDGSGRGIVRSLIAVLEEITTTDKQRRADKETYMKKKEENEEFSDSVLEWIK